LIPLRKWYQKDQHSFVSDASPEVIGFGWIRNQFLSTSLGYH
jgi:hypothetical protein